MEKRVAPGPSSVLILGESGTGKELFAQAIHSASDYRKGPFVSVNCGAIHRELVQSELFGYKEGAFTGARRGGSAGKFEMANGGTLFLDEIGEMPFEMQVNLLRVLEERAITPVGTKEAIPVDFRIIAATNKGLFEEVSKGRFREDLYYRLNVIAIALPPLRTRQEDISPLARYYVEKLSRKVGKLIENINPGVQDLGHRAKHVIRQNKKIRHRVISGKTLTDPDKIAGERFIASNSEAASKNEIDGIAIPRKKLVESFHFF